MKFYKKKSTKEFDYLYNIVGILVSDHQTNCRTAEYNIGIYHWNITSGRTAEYMET